MDIDVAALAEIEAQLTEDTLTDQELVDRLHAAGLPELGRVVARTIRR